MKFAEEKIMREFELINNSVLNILLEIEEILNFNNSNSDNAENSKEKSLKRIQQLTAEKTKILLKMKNSGEISKEVFDFCAQKHFIDYNLLRLWKKNGYEKLCCSSCADSQLKKVCICRVPSHKERDFEECSICGCKGCS